MSTTRQAGHRALRDAGASAPGRPGPGATTDPAPGPAPEPVPGPGPDPAQRLASRTDGTPATGPGGLRVAYLMSRFPKLTETFVLDEILQMQRAGVDVEIFPLRRERAVLMHPEAEALAARAHYTPFLGARILRDNLASLVRSPARYAGVLGTLVRSNWRSRRFLLGSLACFPKAVSLASRMRALGVDHVHAHFASFPAATAFVIGRMSGLPWSFTAHGSDLHRDQAMLDAKLADCAFAVAISDYNRAFMLAHAGAGCRQRIEVIHCGIDLDAFRPAAAHVPGEPLELVCVGTLHAVKGQRHLLEASARLRAQGVPHRCHFVGDGPDRPALERLAHSLGIAESTVFHGACRRGEVRELLSRMHVAVAPSVPTADGRREGIPVALMEAAASGLALVASRLSGIPELVQDGETGLLVTPGDAPALAAALLRYAREPDFRRCMAVAARARVRRDFSLADNVARLEARIRETAVHRVAPA